jgi:hypothetical protein
MNALIISKYLFKDQYSIKIDVKMKNMFSYKKEIP